MRTEDAIRLVQQGMISEQEFRREMGIDWLEDDYQRRMQLAMADPVVTLEQIRAAIEAPDPATYAMVVTGKGSPGYTYKWADGSYHTEPEAGQDIALPEPDAEEGVDPSMLGGLKFYITSANMTATEQHSVGRELTLADLERAMEMMSEPNRTYMERTFMEQGNGH